MTSNSFTLQEIISQPDVWQTALSRLSTWQADLSSLFEQEQPDEVIFSGCGSSYYLAMVAAAVFTHLTGKLGRALPASELWLSPETSLAVGHRSLLVAISRSGTTTETVRASQAFLESRRGALLTMTCQPQIGLAGLGSFNLSFPASDERSLVQTRSFSTFCLAALFLAATFGGQAALLEQLQRLPQIAQSYLEAFQESIAGLAGDNSLDRFYFLGSGERYGLAAELSLKMKEMSLSHSEPFHFLEFRHGPMSMVGSSTLIVGLLSEANRSQEQAVLDEMKLRGARVLSIGEADVDLPFTSRVTEAARGPLYLLPGQLLAFWRASARGLDADRPHGLTKAVHLP